MGLVSQLEPRLSYCFSGTGIDARFDRAVRRGQFQFEFGGFNTKPIPYNIEIRRVPSFNLKVRPMALPRASE